MTRQFPLLLRLVLVVLLVTLTPIIAVSTFENETTVSPKTSNATNDDASHYLRQSESTSSSTSNNVMRMAISSLFSDDNGDCSLSRLHQSCNGPLDDCGCSSSNKNIECSITHGICVRIPRDYGEPCLDSKCREYSFDNPSMRLKCSVSCGVCVAANESVEKTTISNIEEEEQLLSASTSSSSSSSSSSKCLGNNNLESKEYFRTWARTYLTSLPIVTPRNDAELRQILNVTSQNGCKVRPMGTTHSASGVVATNQDSNVIVVSLVDYIPSDGDVVGEGWNKVTIRDGNERDRTAKVRVPGGFTQLQLYSVIRPLGYFLPTQTAGWLFSMAGIISNSVHGGHFDKSFVYSYVTKLRVMLADGTVQVLDQKEDLKMWRNGYGLLGIITAVEFEIEKRDTATEYFTMGVETKSLSPNENWNQVWLNNYITQIKQQNIAAQFFFDPTTKEMTVVTQQIKQRSTGADKSSSATDNDCSYNYWTMSCECNNNACTGGSGRTCSYQYQLGDFTPSQSCRLNDISPPTSNKECTFDYTTFSCRSPKYCSYQFQPGDLTLETSCRLIDQPPPDIDTMKSSYDQLLQQNPNLGFNGIVVGDNSKLQSLNCLANQFGQETLMRQFVLSQIQQLTKEASETTNDGFIVREGTTLPTPFMAYMFSSDHLFDVLTEISKLDFTLNVPIEFRFLTTDDSAMLIPGNLPPNTELVAMECVSLEIPGPSQTSWRSQFYQIEQIYKSVGGIPHTGKYFGMGYSDGVLKPFQNVTSELIFTNEQKRDFETYRQQVDPNNLFYAGFMADYLSMS